MHGKRRILAPVRQVLTYAGYPCPSNQVTDGHECPPYFESIAAYLSHYLIRKGETLVLQLHAFPKCADLVNCTQRGAYEKASSFSFFRTPPSKFADARPAWMVFDRG